MIFHYQATDTVGFENSLFRANKTWVRRQTSSRWLLGVPFCAGQYLWAFLQGGPAFSSCPGHRGKTLALKDLAERSTARLPLKQCQARNMKPHRKLVCNSKWNGRFSPFFTEAPLIAEPAAKDLSAPEACMEVYRKGPANTVWGWEDRIGGTGMLFKDWGRICFPLVFFYVSS